MKKILRLFLWPNIMMQLYVFYAPLLVFFHQDAYATVLCPETHVPLII